MIHTQLSSKVQTWLRLATQLRADSIRCTTAAGSGHPTSSMSAADLMSVLLTEYLRYDFTAPSNPMNDHLIFSKGHASPLLYSLYKAAGAITDEEFLTLRTFGSRLQGHPTPALPWVDVATGSLGQGLSIGAGIAVSGRYLEKLPFHVWVLLGDSEMAEGSVWEAMSYASHQQLGNLVAILDCNRLGQRGETMLGWNTSAYEARAQAFGWNAIVINGHDVQEISNAYEQALQAQDMPTMIIAKTMKGKGVSFLENKDNWHGKALSQEQAEQAMAELHYEYASSFDVQKPLSTPSSFGTSSVQQPLVLPRYEVGSSVSVRSAYGDSLKALGSSNVNVVAVDAEVSNSTCAETFGKAFPERFFEQYIAEQQMIGTAIGLSVRKKIVFASTFAVFFTRAFDFIRMGAISHATLHLTGSHAGVSIGEDGASQMALEDIAMMRSIFGSTVLYPCDGNQTAKLVAQMAAQPGISYLRATREKLPVLYSADEQFPIGGSKTIYSSDQDVATIVAAGITVHEAIQAYQQLQAQGIAVRVIDAYSVKPIDVKALHEAAKETHNRLIVVEDHYPQGGLGDAVFEAFANYAGTMPHITKLAVASLPGSGKPSELLDAAGISAAHIVSAVQAMLQ